MGLGANEQTFDEVGFNREAFALGQVPTTAALSDTSAAVFALDEDRAYAIVTCITISGGDVYAARGQTALDVKGIRLELDIPQKFYGPEGLNAIMGTGAATGVVIVQDFKLGVRRIGDRA